MAGRPRTEADEMLSIYRATAGTIVKKHGIPYFTNFIEMKTFSQMMMPEVMEAGGAAEKQFLDLMATFGNHHRSFGHGALHGGIMTVFFVLPLLAINSLFERRGWKYVFIHLGYWFICLALIGGVLCQTLVYT